MSFDATLDLRPRPSQRALMWAFGPHLLVAAMLPLAMEPGWPMAVLAGAIGLSWLRLRRHPALGFGPHALNRLTWHPEGEWTVHEASGHSFEAELDGSTLTHPQLLVLNFKLKTGGRRTRVLLGDELEPELMRRLRARLSVTG